MFHQTLRSEKTKNGKIKEQVQVGDHVEEREYLDIRAAIVSEPALYGLLLGEEAYERFDAPQDRRGILWLLEEWESTELSLSKFLDQVTDSMSLHSADTLYGDTSQKELADFLYGYLDKRQQRGISFIEAPFSENFRLGISMIQDWINDGLLRIPKKALVWEQLETLSASDIQEAPEKFYRLRTLAFCVGGFQKYAPIRPLRTTNFSYSGGGGPQGWML